MIKHIVKTFFETILFLFLFAVVFVLLSSKTTITNMKSYVVASSSMNPIIPVGSLTFVNIEKNIHIGDVITFKRDSLVVTHRVVNIINGSYQTKGDANKEADNQLVSKSAVIGKTVFAIPQVGYFINFVKSPIGFIALVVIPNLFLIGFEIWNIKEEYKKQIEKNVLAKLNLG